MMQRILRYAAYVIVGFFACVGLVFTAVFFGMQYGLFDVRGSIASRNTFFQSLKTPQVDTSKPCIDTTTQTCAWMETPEWTVIRAGLEKDQTVIDDVSAKTGVPSRLIAAVVVPEQTRFFTSEREIFKQYFEPLKILGSMSQFSLGVSGIKQETADQIEQYAASTTSAFYPGPGFAELITYPQGSEHDTELYNRLTDPKNHYYSYLYTALFIREAEAQWRAAGYDISNNPAVVATLFNIGFKYSHPGPFPSAGGSTITTGGKQYAYGELAGDFYNSSELDYAFPKPN